MKWWGLLLRRELREHASFSEAMRAGQAMRAKAPKPPKAEPRWEIETKQTYLDGPWVAAKFNDGWEILSVQPVVLGGTTLKQSVVTMRRLNPRFEEAGDGSC